MKLSDTSKTIDDFIKFKSLMGVELSSDKISYLWGEESLDGISQKVSKNSKHSPNVESKLSIAQRSKNAFQIFNLVKFVAVTGSVASGAAKEADDIDIFIVTRNHCSWIYRLLVMLKLYKNLLHVSSHVSKDKFCLNYIVEERAINFETHDIFTAHEILFMIPIYNTDFYNDILISNEWLKTDYHIDYSKVQARVSTTTSVLGLLFFPINMVTFVLQLFYMFIKGHHPEIRRLILNYIKGRIAFYPSDFKHKSLKQFKQNS